MIQYRVLYTNWKGNESVAYVFADSLEHAKKIIGVMQGVGEVHSIVEVK